MRCTARRTQETFPRNRDLRQCIAEPKMGKDDLPVAVHMHSSTARGADSVLWKSVPAPSHEIDDSSANAVVALGICIVESREGRRD